MSFAAAITRCPIPHDPDAGAEAAARFAGLGPELRAVLAGTAGCSPYLRGLMQREAAWLDQALAADPAGVLPELAAALDTCAPADLPGALRQAKGRVALYAGLADLAGVWDLAQVTGALTDFADLSTGLALRAALAGPLGRGRIPGQGPDDLATAAGMVVLAMGKMGAHELNYSSDIDLIVLFDDSRFDADDLAEARAQFIRITRAMTAMLSDMTGQGYVWRTDLRLRPDPSVTPVCLSMTAAERYYESLGRTWERAAHIKARPCAGDLAAGAGYLDRLRPFVWRRHLDYASVQDAHDMRLRIRAHKGLHETGRLEGRNLKLGPGGIREIEFFTQTRQLIAGGRDPGLRQRETVAALAALAERGWIPGQVAADLTGHYRALREIEHRVQMVADARTHALPTTPEGFDRLARMCGQGDTAAFCAALSDRLAAVAAETEVFFADGMVGSESLPAPDGPEPGPEPEIVQRWRHYPALRSARAQALFERLKPDLLARLRAAARPDEALSAFDGFLAGLPAGVQLFAMFQANPQLRALIVDIAATSPALARYLARHSRVFEAVIGGSFFAPWPGRAALAQDLARELSEAQDFEAALNAARRWAREWHFRIGVHHLRGLTEPEETGQSYADLAAAVLSALYPVVVAELSRRHGPPPGQGAAVLGMGSLGAGWLTAASDLDLIVIYDPAGQEMSEGRRPIATRAWYAKLTQSLVTALTAQTAEGRLYEVDMRLRPSGRQGPVATTLTAFDRYQREEAWTWEHLALTRARFLAGDPAVGAAAEQIRAEVLALPGDRARVVGDVIQMRARLAEAKGLRGPLDAKAGPGNMADIELMAQTLALLAGSGARGVAQQLRAGPRAGLIGAEDARALDADYRLLRAAQGALRLLAEGLPAPADLGAGAQAMLLRETGQADMDGLVAAMQAARSRAAGLIGACLETLS